MDDQEKKPVTANVPESAEAPSGQEAAQEPVPQNTDAAAKQPGATGLFGRKKTPVTYEEKTFLGIKYKKKVVPKRPWYIEVISWILTFLVALAIALPIRSFVFEFVKVDGRSMNDTLQDGEVMLVDKTRYASTWLCLPWWSDESKQDASRLTSGGDPQRFDVVICRYPDRGDTNFVKRAVGLPGDTVQLDSSGYLWVNGERYEEPYVNDSYRRGMGGSFSEFTVPKKGDALTVEQGVVHVNGVAWRWGAAGEIRGVSESGEEFELRHHRFYINGKEAAAEAAEGKTYYLQSDYFFVMGDHRDSSRDSRMVGPIERSMVVGRVSRVILPFGSGRQVLNGLDWK